MAHPDDYKEIDTFEPQFIYHLHVGKHNRLIARIAWKLPGGKVVPMSFVCDTGAPSHFYLSKKALDVLQKHRLIKEYDRETQYVKVQANKHNIFNANIEETPYIHRSANIIGLKVLKKLHLNLADNTFSFNKDFVYL